MLSITGDGTCLIFTSKNFYRGCNHRGPGKEINLQFEQLFFSIVTSIFFISISFWRTLSQSLKFQRGGRAGHSIHQTYARPFLKRLNQPAGLFELLSSYRSVSNLKSTAFNRLGLTE
ncbi:hypothetical protein BDW72DRAFT_1333 [Aspergillus terricola var. indicus]